MLYRCHNTLGLFADAFFREQPRWTYARSYILVAP